MTTDELIETLERLEKEATPGDLSTAGGGAREQDDVECPACGGEGVLSATDYCNFDGAATGVQFFGIGPEFGAHERLWRFFMQNRKAIISAIKENKRLREALSDATEAIIMMSGSSDFASDGQAGAWWTKFRDEKFYPAILFLTTTAALQPQGGK